MAAVGRRAGTAVGALAVLVAVGLVVAAWSVLRVVEVTAAAGDAERATDSAEAAAGRAADEVAHQQALRSGAELRLGDAVRALTAADDALDLADAEHAGVVAELRAMRVRLVELRGAVAGAAGTAFANATLVGQLATCLDGLSELVNQLAVGDRRGAVATIDDIGPSCAAVGAVIA